MNKIKNPPALLPYVSVTQAALIAGVDRSLIGRLTKQGRITSYKVGHQRIVDTASVLEWMGNSANHRRGPKVRQSSDDLN